jgi:hypothetical protein
LSGDFVVENPNAPTPVYKVTMGGVEYEVEQGSLLTMPETPVQEETESQLSIH